VYVLKPFVTLQIVFKASCNGVQLLSNLIKCPHLEVTENVLEESQSFEELKEITSIFLNPIIIPGSNLDVNQKKVSL